MSSSFYLCWALVRADGILLNICLKLQHFIYKLDSGSGRTSYESQHCSKPKRCPPCDLNTMQYEDFIKLFNKQVFTIDYNRQLILAIEVCKKLYFDYVEFSEKYHLGDKDILLDAIDILEKSKCQEISRSLIDQMLIQLDNIIPDMDDFESDEFASYALNSCLAVYNSIQFILDKLPKHIYDIGICLTDTIDLKIQEQQNFAEQEIDKNPLMIEARQYLIEMSK